ncbi:Pyridoxal 5'-phosphate synthase (glutamine hydrolyzing), glutaminase subunit [Olavius algarvensis spirochete endosymbiont]|uniref:pyridoxal 5'-phosphate synthase glutaminase subunit PdxT n=1 Tax=Olavius algarvensis spirochete endosymbiont TaxID=260710 RepID=UPI000F130B6D|nr:pyridoxal 5'-phosphate synthase glutaminase subunit PdxT [Olavius algarvensis spirochete endosymbiont]VDA99311.1 Pyridoxal 5'-phosphate synthase (glutamine hydrolyzing), glutaminase subunit [Olavius algarvensis spirochete endosymbiont]
MKPIGVLALQGDFLKHIQVLEEVGAETVQVRDVENLRSIGGLIIPGGESTTISKMLRRWNLMEPIIKLVRSGLPVFGTCAGLILLADELVNWNHLPRIGGLNLIVTRNAYGRQIDSFEAQLEIDISGGPTLSSFTGVFIRAPRIESNGLGAEVEVLSSFEGFPVLVRQKTILAASFHPELSGDVRLHSWFLEYMVEKSN